MEIPSTVIKDWTTDDVTFLEGYVEAMLWANAYDSAEGLPIEDSDEEAGVENLDMSAWGKMAADCAAFLAPNRTLLNAAAEFRNWDYLGHDFALNRNSHGTGFWDRGLGLVGDALDKAAHAAGEAHLVLENGVIYPE